MAQRGVSLLTCMMTLPEAYIHLLVSAILEHDNLSAVTFFCRRAEEDDLPWYIVLLQGFCSSDSTSDAGDYATVPFSRCAY